MTHGIAFTVSASIALTATQAMASIQDRVVDMPEDMAVSPELGAKIDAALAKRSVREGINDVFAALTHHYGADGVALAERYRTDPSTQMASTYDSTTSEGFSCYTNCYGNCHSACHSACHGSRGWR